MDCCVKMPEQRHCPLLLLLCCLQQKASHHIRLMLIQIFVGMTYQNAKTRDRSPPLSHTDIASHWTIYLSCRTIRGGQAQLIFASAIAIPQLEGSTSAIAIPQLLKKCCSATATPQTQFVFESATSELHFRNFQCIFGRKIRSIHEKKNRR
jgi:hypothetical protein